MVTYEDEKKLQSMTVSLRMQRDEKTGKLNPEDINKRKLRMVKDAIFTRANAKRPAP